MVRRRRCCSWACLFGLLITMGCDSGSGPAHPVALSPEPPTLRVLLLEKRAAITLTASQPPTLRLGGSASARRLDLAPNTPATIEWIEGGWRVGGTPLGAGVLAIEPAVDASVAIEGKGYHGKYQLVPTGPATFDVVNDVDLETYLKDVVTSELPADWLDETYRAQAIVARTYALYEFRSAPPNAWFDLYGDERSQMYNGVARESPKARLAVDSTRGMVVAAGPAGHERIIKAYFSSCCGGVGQSAADAFGDPPSGPLTEQAVGTLCSASPHFNWPPVTISKAEITRRLRKFGTEQNRAEKDIGEVTRLDVVASNSLGRPVKFALTDSRGRQFIMSGQDFRLAINADASPTTRLLSSYFQIDNQPQAIRFLNGHGSGHGVGMCQWCAQRRAEMGMGCEQIVALAFPGTTLLRAY